MGREAELLKNPLVVVRRHRLLWGDLMVEGNIDLLMDGQLADIIYSDLPYNEEIMNQFRLLAGYEKRGFDEFLRSVSMICKKYSKGPIYLEIGTRTFEALREAMESAGAITEGIYSGTYGKKGKNYIWRGSFKEMEWQKYDPGYGAQSIDRAFGFGHPKGGIMLDFCIGTGLTARVATKKNLIVYGMEINHKRLFETIAFLRRINHGKRIEWESGAEQSETGIQSESGAN